MNTRSIKPQLKFHVRASAFLITFIPLLIIIEHDWRDFIYIYIFFLFGIIVLIFLFLFLRLKSACDILAEILPACVVW